MGYDKKSNAKKYNPQDDDTLDKIAEREGSSDNPLTGADIAKFNWGTDDPDVIDEHLRDELGCYKVGVDNRFVISADVDARSDLLIPQAFKKTGLAVDHPYTIKVNEKDEPPIQFEGCAMVKGVNFEFDKSFVRPSVVDDLDKLENTVNSFPSAKILVFGHTDPVGSDDYNKRLSERRAKSIYAFITNQPDIWEDLYNQENWGLKSTQTILKDLGGAYDPGPVDGINGPQTRTAVENFQRDNGLSVDGVAGPNTRRKLYEAYMTGLHDIEIEDSRFMDPKHMGCSEFNPVAPASTATDTTVRNAENEPNRRVTFFLFNEGRLPVIPCRHGNLSPCQKRIATPLPRHKDTFKCSFYDSLAKNCPGEGGKEIPIIPMVTPIITPGRAIAVLVKKDHTTPQRQRIVLSVDNNMTGGNGTLTASPAKVKFFDAPTEGNEILLDGTANVFSHTQINGGITLYIEGTTVSDTKEDIEIRFTVSPSAQTAGPAASVKVTAVEITLDIYKTRTVKDQDPDPIEADKKFTEGRFIHEQDASNHHGRAMVKLHRAKPKDFDGVIDVAPLDAKVELFAAETGGAALNAITHQNTTINETTGVILWAQGKTVSGALRDTGVRSGLHDIDPEGDKVAVTVVKFTRIEAKIKPTPANTARAGIAAPAIHTYTTTSMDESFDTNTPLVLMHMAQPDNELEVTATPAGLTIQWAAIRNTDDHASLGSATDLPTLTPDGGDSTKCILEADQKGSFRIRPFIDCNGSGTYDPEIDKPPSMPMNLILANATRVRDKSKGNQARLTHTTQPTFLSIRNGTWPAVHRNPTNADLNNAGMAMELDADVTGGGADGRLGLDMVFGGFINDLRNVQVDCDFIDNTVAPPTHSSLRNLYVSNPGDATGNLHGRPMFVAGDPAANILAFPILDSGRGSAGTGADKATMTRSYPATRTNRPVGIRYNIRCIDSPGRGIEYDHPVNANAKLRSITYRHQFTGFFAFWTNNTKVRTQSGDPADRLYSVITSLEWECVGDFTLTYPGGTATLGGGATHRVRWDSTNIDPIERAQDNNVEVRPPAGITAGFAWDAR
jgi:hypothetical protein